MDVKYIILIIVNLTLLCDTHVNCWQLILSPHKVKLCFFFLLFLYPYEMMDVSLTCCGNHFTIYVSQIIMLYTLKLYSACAESLSHAWLFVTPWTAAHQAALSMGLSQQEYWSGKGLPWWFRWQSVCLQYGRHGFDPWVGKIPWRRKWQLTPVFLPGKIPWMEEPVRLQPMGSQRVGHDWTTSLLRFPPPGDLPNPTQGLNLHLLHCRKIFYHWAT